TEDRQLTGLIIDWSISKNITLSEIKQFANHGFIDDKKERMATKELAEKFDVKAVNIFELVSSLSGGNQQKVAVAKALASELKVLILDEPTKGVDIGAKAAIYEIIGELAQKGFAIIIISSEMPEVLGMSDRIYVMCEGRMTGELKAEDATQEKILQLSMKKYSGETGGNYDKSEQ
ncbi:MAG: sugar ABC transporter ATP-binding protein, partial [Clostridiaceae bacterium]|nr:sugar ABC transporter ATP-binding protein [Clostridiaceae bacterium]